MSSRALVHQKNVVKCQLYAGAVQTSPSPSNASSSGHRPSLAFAQQPARRCLAPAHTATVQPSSFVSSAPSISAALRPGRPGRRHVAASAQAGRGGKGNGGTDEEPDWEAEMSIFKQRISRPNQLATLRELEAKVSVGKVLYARDGLAIVSGLNTDAPLGTKVSFVTGTAGVLLWHRSDNLSFCLVLGDPSTVSEGTPVECKIKGVLQVVDDVKGPITRKDFETFNVPAGEDAFGRVCDHIGRHLPEYDDAVSASSAAALVSPAASRSPAAGSGGSSSSGGSSGGSSNRFRPLVNQQVDMKNREQINESLLTGVKALDILTPFGRGASLLVIGPSGSGKTRLALDAIAGQARWSGAAAAAATAVPTPPGGPVRCVLALAGRTKAEVQAVVSELRSSGSLFNTAVVAVEEGAPLGHQYAAMCCACAIGERVRDEGGHSLVVVDDIRPLSDVWEQLLGGLAGLGPALLREGLVKDERGRDMPVVPPPGSTSASASAADVSAADAPSSSSTPASVAAAAAPPRASSPGTDSSGIEASGSSGSSGSGGGGSGSLDDDGALVEYEGMLVSGAMAQRRGFLSTFFMRAAKMSRSNGGGSMSLVPLVPGTCATGVSRRIDMSKYKTLSPEQLAKLEAALRAKMLAEELAAGAGSGELATEVVEEFISIADGQVVLEGSQQQQQQLPGPVAYSVNPKLSITRIGTRAFYKALEQLAPQVRLDLAQADDARRFGGAVAVSTSSVASGSSIDLGGGGGSGSGVRLAAADLRADALARRLSAALLQAPGRPASLAEQVATLFAVQRGFADSIPPERLPGWLQAALQHVAATAPAAMQELGRTGMLTAESEAAISAALNAFRAGP
ncbi:hypothetical protein VaNZ11_007548 [Volvox africanus]|uniref:Uncharacterized protein n=1 Tax=Volvox africanus TaxID=51714 RepID=A0ABQ5S391_9CHLO|nr:hypothetical protein VaNZ11_007548 [Volvox africanus]